MKRRATYAAPAEKFRLGGDLKNALKCHRAIPDFAAALDTVRQMAIILPPVAGMASQGTSPRRRAARQVHPG